jgi:hypothetical protein
VGCFNPEPAPSQAAASGGESSASPSGSCGATHIAERLNTLRRRLLRFLIGCHLLKASIVSSRLLDECSYDEGDASYDEDGGEDGRECGHCFSASSTS